MGFLLGVMLCSGCAMYQAGFRNLVVAPLQYRSFRDQRMTEAYACGVAQEAVERMRCENSSLSQDYLDGFEQGVIDQITYGGDELPPIVPPRHYWTLPYRVGDHCQAPQEWLDGCEAGRRYAASTGIPDRQPVKSSPVMHRELDYPTDIPQTVERLPARPHLEHSLTNGISSPDRNFEQSVTTPTIQVRMRLVPESESSAPLPTEESSSPRLP